MSKDLGRLKSLFAKVCQVWQPTMISYQASVVTNLLHSRLALPLMYEQSIYTYIRSLLDILLIHRCRQRLKLHLRSVQYLQRLFRRRSIYSVWVKSPRLLSGCRRLQVYWKQQRHYQITLVDAFVDAILHRQRVTEQLWSIVFTICAHWSMRVERSILKSV